MKKIKLNLKPLAGLLGACLLVSMPTGLTSCKEEIDESNFAIKSEMTAADFIESDAKFSMAKQLFLTVRLGKSDNASPIYSALTARGNYTVFLPTNDAVTAFYQSKHLTSFEELLQNPELSNLVAKSCIMDHENDNAKETVDFPTSGSFDKPNLNDRLLTCKVDTLDNFIINGTSKVIDADNEVSNGFVHVVDQVVAPSDLTLNKLIDKAGNLRFFSHLLKTTTWADSLTKYFDDKYEDPERPLTYNLPNVKEFKNQEHRYFGYTAFVEPDNVYEQELGLQVLYDEESGTITNSADLLAALEKKVESVYGSAEVGNYSHPDNAVNRFVAYHLLKGRMAYNKMVHHYNEYGFDYVNPKHPKVDNNKMPTNVWDFFVTMGKYRSLLKITQVGDASTVAANASEHPIYVNRVSKYASEPTDNYHENGVLEEGYLVHEHNVNAATGELFDNNGLNGFYYPLDALLLYKPQFRDKLETQRIRFDVSTILHELLSNDVRGGEYKHFENYFFEDIKVLSQDTKLLYLMSESSASWKDYQGDEFMVSGLYDFTMKLPPVPTKGTYEIRMGVSHNSLRGMCQIYFGPDDPDRLMPAGLPYDMRQSTKNNPAIPWVKDGEEEKDKDWEIIRENDKKLRNQGYMKGPQYFLECKPSFEERKPVRDVEGNSALRRIVTVADMDPDRTYYLRFKTALKKLDSQFFMDYFEYAHTSVYNGPTAEDIW